MIFANNSCNKLLTHSLGICLCLLLSISFIIAQSAFLSVTSLSSSPPSINDSLENVVLQSIDGPYLYRDKNGGRMLSVVKRSHYCEIIEEYIDLAKKTTFSCAVDNNDKDVFTFELIDKIKSPKSIYKQPEKLLAISDIEGNFNAFYSLLLANEVMDEDFNWTYGKGHLVLTGDFMDRGKNVTQVLWLIYKLDQEAKKQGGVVHFILGNHETMNLRGTINYVDKKYIKLAQKYSRKINKKAAYANLMADNLELVRWMKSKNAIEKIGDILFVHGGISPELVAAKFSINEINETIRSGLDNKCFKNANQKLNEDFLFASLGPLWFRGMAVRYRNYYKKSTEKEVDKALKHFRVKHIAIGHTTVEEVCTDFNGKVIRTDVRHPDFKNSTHTQAFLRLNNQFFRVDGQGNQFSLTSELLTKKE